MSKHTLDPCPFCGEQPEINDIEAHSHSFQIDGFKMPDHPGSCVIECACGAGLIDSDFNTVATRWNTRAMPLPEVTIIEINTEVLRKENEQLQSKIQKIQKLLSDDGYAISFQSLGQYRTALIKALKGGAA